MTLVLTALLLQGTGAQAANLDKDTCARLEEEQSKLEKAGVRATLAKGAAWAKDNLPLDKLQEVRRLIEVDEQILFRCQGKPLVLLPSSVDADPVVRPRTTTRRMARSRPTARRLRPRPRRQGCQGAGTQGGRRRNPARRRSRPPAKKAPPAAPKATAPVQAKPKQDAAAKSEAVDGGQAQAGAQEGG